MRKLAYQFSKELELLIIVSELGEVATDNRDRDGNVGLKDCALYSCAVAMLRALGLSFMPIISTLSIGYRRRRGESNSRLGLTGACLDRAINVHVVNIDFCVAAVDLCIICCRISCARR